MKHIKLFESFISKEELVQDAEDICLELNDANIRTKCWYKKPYATTSGKSKPGFIYVEIWHMEDEDLEWHEVEEVFDRLIDYFESNGWKLGSIIMDGDTLINPKGWIETLRKKVNYTFFGLTINFIED